MKKLLVLLFVLLLLLAGEVSASPRGIVKGEKETIAAWITERAEKHGNRFGIVVGLVDSRGSSILFRGPARNGAAADGDSIFDLASVSKLFTAALLAEMAERGEVGLDDPIGKSLPASPSIPSDVASRITLRHLATHTSGLPSAPNNSGPTSGNRPGYVAYTEPLLLEFLSGFKPARPAGSEFSYSNLGMGLLGHLLSRHAGRPLAALFRERIFGPLKMTSSGTRGEMEKIAAARLTVGHSRDGSPSVPWPMAPVLHGAGGIHSTARDMLRFLSASIGFTPSPLARALKAMQQVRHPLGTAGSGIGLGWMVTRAEGRFLLSHTGGVEGYNCFIGIDLLDRRGVIVLANSSVSVTDIGAGILLRTLEPPPAAGSALGEMEPLPSPTASDLPGMYEITPGFHALVTREESGLFVQTPWQSRFPLESRGGNSFAISDGTEEARIDFTPDGSGKTASLRILQGAISRSCPRVPEPAAARIDPAALAALAGLYEIDPASRALVCAESGRLFFQPGMQPRIELFPSSPRDFFSKLDDLRVSFTTSSDGAVTGLAMTRGGSERSCRRLPDPGPSFTPTAPLREYTGRYQVTPRFRITVTLDGGRLYAQGTGQPVFELFPEGPDLFSLRVIDARIQFRRAPQGQVSQVAVLTAGPEEVGTRTD